MISLVDVARACDVSKAGLYYHFNSKQALLAAIISYAQDIHEEEVQKVLADSAGDDADDLRRLIHAHAVMMTREDDAAFAILAVDEMRSLLPTDRARGRTPQAFLPWPHSRAAGSGWRWSASCATSTSPRPRTRWPAWCCGCPSGTDSRAGCRPRRWRTRSPGSPCTPCCRMERLPGFFRRMMSGNSSRDHIRWTWTPLGGPRRRRRGGDRERRSRLPLPACREAADTPRRRRQRHSHHPRHSPDRPSLVLRLEGRGHTEHRRVRRRRRPLHERLEYGSPHSPRARVDHDRPLPARPRRPRKRRHRPRRAHPHARRAARQGRMGHRRLRERFRARPPMGESVAASTAISTTSTGRGWRRQTRRTWGRCGATAHKTVAAAVSWLDERPTGRPFFLWLHLYDPHDPYAPREPFTSRYPGRPYDAAVAYTDSLVGHFRRALVERHLLEDSLLTP